MEGLRGLRFRLEGGNRLWKASVGFNAFDGKDASLSGVGFMKDKAMRSSELYKGLERGDADYGFAAGSFFLAVLSFYVYVM